jgi:hypothetical protein
MSGGVAMDLRTIQRPVCIGIVGSGFIARNFSVAIAGDGQFTGSHVLTLRLAGDEVITFDDSELPETLVRRGERSSG